MLETHRTATAHSAGYLLVAAACAVWGLSAWAIPAADPDLGWHLFGGAWIAEHGGVPRHDPINTFRPEWHDYHWLAQLVMFEAFRLGGYDALRWGLAVVTALLYLSLFVLGRRAGPGRTALEYAAVLTPACLLIQEVNSIRPQMAALPVIALATARMQRRPGGAEMIALFLGAALLANVHVYWIFLAFLWFVYRCLPRFVRPKRAPSALYAWGGLFLIAAAGLVSPYGLLAQPENRSLPLSNYSLVLDYLFMPEIVSTTVNEFRSGLSEIGATQFVLLGALAAAARSFRLRRAAADLGNSVLALTGFVLAMLAVKYVAVFAIFALPWFVRHLPRFQAPRRVETGLLTLLVLAGTWFAVRGAPPFNRNFDLLEPLAPIKACRKLPHLGLVPAHGRDHVRVLTHFNHGGWCRWIAHLEAPQFDLRVTTDNRTQGVPGEHYQESFDLFRVRWQWLATLREWDPDAAVVGKEYSLAGVLLLARGLWDLVYEDDHFAVFVPRRESQAGRIAADPAVR